MPIFMRLWVGRAFAEHAAPVGMILMIGIWINGLAFIPYGHLQATNRPDVPAKFHAYEIFPFLGVLWLGLHYFGLIGAAWAWTLRVAIDGILLFAVAGRIPKWWRILPGGLLLLLAAASAPSEFLSMRTGVEFVVILTSGLWSWNASPLIRSTVQRFVVRSELPAAV